MEKRIVGNMHITEITTKEEFDSFQTFKTYFSRWEQLEWDDSKKYLTIHPVGFTGSAQLVVMDKNEPDGSFIEQWGK